MFARYAHRYDASTVRLKQRLYLDSWGLLASSTDGRYFVDLGRRWSLWPHARLHVQSGVTFWKCAYSVIGGPGGDWSVPTYRTGDRELYRCGA